MTPRLDSTPSFRPTSQRNGFATAAALVATTVLLFAGAAAWWMAFRATDEARRTHAVSQAELAARAGLRLTAANPVLPLDLPLGARRFVGSIGLAPLVSSRVHVERVGREWFLMHAEGIQTRPPARRSIGYAAWALHPTARLAAARAVVAVGGHLVMDVGSQIRADSIHGPPPGWAPFCVPLLSAADSAVPGGLLAATAIDTTTAVRLGRLDAGWLAAAADHQTTGVVTPTPQMGPGGCNSGASNNWGDPSGSGACSGHRPLIASRGDLVVRGGTGQGVLVVQGDLYFEAGAQFSGVVLVSGSLQLSASSHVTGLVRVGGHVGLVSSRIRGSSCAALLALSHPALTVSQPVPGGWVDPL